MSPKQIDWTLDLDKVDPKDPKQLLELHIQGMSYREMERVLGVKKTTAHNRVRRYLQQQGIDPNHRTFNLAQALRSDYLSLDSTRKGITKRHQKEIKVWMHRNLSKLYQIEGTFFSEEQEKNIGQRETSSWGDWRPDLAQSA